MIATSPSTSTGARRKFRSPRRAMFCIAAAALFLSGACAPVSKLPQMDKASVKAEAQKQRQLIVEDRMENYRRLVNVAYPLLERNAELCRGNVKPSLEAILANKHSFGKDLEAAMARMGFGETANLFAVASVSPLAQAGLTVGDTLVAVNEWTVPRGRTAAIDAAAKFAEVAQRSQTVRLTVATRNGTRAIDVVPRRVCAYEFGVEFNEEVNAHADGERVIFGSGMMRFVRDDVELATVFGHELAHNLMGHIAKTKANVAIGTVVDRVFTGFGADSEGRFSEIGAQAYSQAFEAEADYVGLYLTARGGFPVRDAGNFWRRMATLDPGSVKPRLAASHPPTPERFVLLERTAAEIDAKARAGAPLVPEIAK